MEFVERLHSVYSGVALTITILTTVDSKLFFADCPSDCFQETDLGLTRASRLVARQFGMHRKTLMMARRYLRLLARAERATEAFESPPGCSAARQYTED